MTSLWHRTWGSSRESTLRKWVIWWKTHTPIGHTRYVQTIENKVKQLLIALEALEDQDISSDKCFKASGMRNHRVFNQLWNNQKYRLLRVCRTLTETIISTEKPKKLSQQDELKLQKIQRQIGEVSSHSPAIRSLVSQIRLSIDSLNSPLQ